MLKSLRLVFNHSYSKNLKLLALRKNHDVSTGEHIKKSDYSINIVSSRTKNVEPLCSCDNPDILAKCSGSIKCQYRVSYTPVFIKVYGCQMNVNDSDIVRSILKNFGYEMIEDENKAEIYLIMTCAIRNSAESKVWEKLYSLKKLKESSRHPLRQVGLLGCMAERLKEKLLEVDKVVDIVAGPDSYRDLPRLFSVNRMSRDKAVNCLLSFDETYSDIRPVTNLGQVTSFVSITRGCDNLCSYCVVPFTRGKERTRPILTILDEIKQLFNRGVREVTLLGQNVNSYRDLGTSPEEIDRPDLVGEVKAKEQFAEGFKTVYKPRTKGLTFDILLEEVAKLSPELRIRFTSPHPKDFTDDVIDVIARYPNISRCIHLPAQSGSNYVLDRMRRGYTREAYLDLVKRMRNAIPGLALKTDIITGFCGETEKDHQLTLDLIRQVKYSYVYAFPYSRRSKTHAHYKYIDDVDRETKVRRIQEVANLFREIATDINNQLVGTNQLVLVETKSRKSDFDFVGRIDSDVKTVIPQMELLDLTTDEIREIKPGDYVMCSIHEANSQTLKAIPNYITSQHDYHNCQPLENKRKLVKNE